jgi:hypothetical protein
VHPHSSHVKRLLTCDRRPDGYTLRNHRMSRVTPSPSRLSSSSTFAGTRRSTPAASSSSSSLTAEQAEFYAYIRHLQLRTSALLSTLGQVDTRHIQHNYTALLDKLTLIAQQLTALQADIYSSTSSAPAAAGAAGGAGGTSAFSTVPQSLSSSAIVYPLVAGYDPSDELRIKAIPEVELAQQRSVTEWLEANNGGEGVTAHQLADRLNAYNVRCAELRAMCAAMTAQQTAQQQQAANDAAEGGKDKKSASRRREESNEEELQRTLRKVMTGWTLRPD